MSLSCECDTDDAEWYFYGPEDTDNDGYRPLSTKRSRKCCSCKERIAVGDLSVRFTRYRYPKYDSVEERIYGEGCEIAMAPWFMCERCGDLYYSLVELGFCVILGDSMTELVKEYAEMNRAKWEDNTTAEKSAKGK